VKTFLDTSVLVAGLVDFGPQSAPAQTIMHAVAENTLRPASTAWYCCLEFYSVVTRLPPEFRLAPADAVQLLTDEIMARLTIHDLPELDRGFTTRTSRKWRGRRAPTSSSPTTGATSSPRSGTASASRRRRSSAPC
jgi:hypothetical protein